uniref:Uncharacterized protein n=1 Tax=Arundo donax TaxID=35708 RepID=A0A0A8ZML9_ARUDO
MQVALTYGNVECKIYYKAEKHDHFKVIYASEGSNMKVVLKHKYLH